MDGLIASTGNALAGVKQVSVTIPSEVQAGDDLLLFGIARANLPNPPPTFAALDGWTIDGPVTWPATTSGAVWRRAAQPGDGGTNVTLQVTDTPTPAAMIAIIAVVRNVDLSGAHWTGSVSDENLPAGYFFLAFTASAENVGAPQDLDGNFTLVEHEVASFNPAQHGGLFAGVAPTFIQQVRLVHSDGISHDFLQGSWRVGGPILDGTYRPRIRSHVSEDAGSLFQATQAVAVESAVSEAFPFGTDIPASDLRTFREALTPDEVALRYYALPTRNQEMLVTVEGETNLGRMARVYPGPIMTRVADIPGHSGETMTAQEAIQHVFDRWSSEFPWFQPLPVPDLRLLVGEAVADPRQYYIDHPEAGVLTTEAIVIPQDGDNRRTMREIIDEWLTIFPGTIVRQNAAGSIELVPRVGPDAPDEALTLEWRDILSMSDGEDDPRGVFNVGRTTSQGWEWQEDQAVVPPLYVLATRSDGLTPEAMEEVTDDLSAEPLVNGGEREFEVFVEPDTPLDVDVTFSAWSASNPSGTGGLTEEVNLSISFDVALGQTRIVEFSWYMFGVDNEKTFAHVTRTERGLKVRVVGDRYRFGPNPFAGTRYVAYLLEVTAVTGTAWTRSNEAVTSEFSLANGDVVPGPDGSNALATSTALYGEREATIRSDVFQLTPEQAQAVAQGFVLFNINPRTIRDVQQSEWNAYPVKFDHVGRLVDLPNGERAVVENRSYSDSFAPDGGFMQSTFTATVSELVIDTSTEYLYLDNGDYMRLDDGELIETS